MLFRSQTVLNAEGGVGLLLDVQKSDIDEVLDMLPALRRPTVSPLVDEDWVALTTIVDEYVVRDQIPNLKEAGAEGIVEYPLNKIVE